MRFLVFNTCLGLVPHFPIYPRRSKSVFFVKGECARCGIGSKSIVFIDQEPGVRSHIYLIHERSTSLLAAGVKTHSAGHEA